jgi:hypothetical protein
VHPVVGAFLLELKAVNLGLEKMSWALGLFSLRTPIKGLLGLAFARHALSRFLVTLIWRRHGQERDTLAHRLLTFSCKRGKCPGQLTMETRLRTEPQALLKRLETITRGEELLQRLRELSQHAEERLKQVLSTDESGNQCGHLSKVLSSAFPQSHL